MPLAVGRDPGVAAGDVVGVQPDGARGLAPEHDLLAERDAEPERRVALDEDEAGLAGARRLGGGPAPGLVPPGHHTRQFTCSKSASGTVKARNP